jgi:hypothetical protein
LECVGLSKVPKGIWICPWHNCCKCLRTRSLSGHVLFQCMSCPECYCFDCFPKDIEISSREPPKKLKHHFEKLGFSIPANSIFYTCKECVLEMKKKKEELEKQTEMFVQLQRKRKEELMKKRAIIEQETSGVKYITAERAPTVAAPVDVFDLTLEKGQDGFGFAMKMNDGGLPEVISMLEGGVAEKSGKMLIGDVIIGVNSNSSIGLTYLQILNVLKSSNVVSLRLRRKRTAYKSPAAAATDSSDEFSVIVPNGPLGILMECRMNATGNLIVHSFQRAADGSMGPAERTGKLAIGDIVMSQGYRSEDRSFVFRIKRPPPASRNDQQSNASKKSKVNYVVVNEAEGIYIIKLKKGPEGYLMNTRLNSSGLPVVVSFSRASNGTVGPAEASRGIGIGDVIMKQEWRHSFENEYTCTFLMKRQPLDQTSALIGLVTKMIRKIFVPIVRGPLGYLFSIAPMGEKVVLSSFNRGPNGEKGPLEESESVSVGDVLLGVDNVTEARTPFEELMRYLGSRDSAVTFVFAQNIADDNSAELASSHIDTESFKQVSIDMAIRVARANSPTNKPKDIALKKQPEAKPKATFNQSARGNHSTIVVCVSKGPRGYLMQTGTTNTGELVILAFSRDADGLMGPAEAAGMRVGDVIVEQQWKISKANDYVCTFILKRQYGTPLVNARPRKILEKSVTLTKSAGGFLFNISPYGENIIIDRFVKDSLGEMGPAEKCGRIFTGDIILGIDDLVETVTPLHQIFLYIRSHDTITMLLGEVRDERSNIPSASQQIIPQNVMARSSTSKDVILFEPRKVANLASTEMYPQIEKSEMSVQVHTPLEDIIEVNAVKWYGSYGVVYDFVLQEGHTTVKDFLRPHGVIGDIEAAGVKVGDILLSINGVEGYTSNEYLGDTATFKFKKAASNSTSVSKSHVNNSTSVATEKLLSSFRHSSDSQENSNVLKQGKFSTIESGSSAVDIAPIPKSNKGSASLSSLTESEIAWSCVDVTATQSDIGFSCVFRKRSSGEVILKQFLNDCGRIGDLEASGRVKVGDVLMAMNRVPINASNFAALMQQASRTATFTFKVKSSITDLAIGGSGSLKSDMVSRHGQKEFLENSNGKQREVTPFDRTITRENEMAIVSAGDIGRHRKLESKVPDLTAKKVVGLESANPNVTVTERRLSSAKEVFSDDDVAAISFFDEDEEN